MSHLRIVPLGGLGEIGMNCLALESPEGILLIDCGVTFPHEENGIDLIHPAFDYLQDRWEDLLGVVVTHGHEDHIGAIPYLLRSRNVPVYAPPYALGLMRERFKEFSDLKPILRPTRPRLRFDLGPFAIEPLRVTHSIPDATALAIECAAGQVIHTGDFKIDRDPTDGEHIDRDRFEHYGAKGVDLLLSDSTNVDVPGWSGGERAVGSSLTALISKCRWRVVVGIFPSNVYRLRALLEAAVATDRKVVFLGRSVQTHARNASELGRMGFPSDLIVPPDRAQSVPRARLLVVASGTQGERQSALGRLAANDHPRLGIEAGDSVILSARTIPGNDRAVWSIVCDLERRGMDVHIPALSPGLHVSGHAYREEQAEMIAWTQPRGFIPVHGTYHHLARHARLAKEAGVEQVEVIENGETVFLDANGLSQGARVATGRVHVEGTYEVHDDVIRERALLGHVGGVFVGLTVDAKGALLGEPTISTRGVTVVGDEEAAREAARAGVAAAVRALSAESAMDYEAIRDAARRAARRPYQRGPKRPLVTVSILER
ncbi:MAG: ribonuclease J [Polyangiales bacterium]